MSTIKAIDLSRPLRLLKGDLVLRTEPYELDKDRIWVHYGQDDLLLVNAQTGRYLDDDDSAFDALNKTLSVTNFDLLDWKRPIKRANGEPIVRLVNNGRYTVWLHVSDSERYLVDKETGFQIVGDRKIFNPPFSLIN